MTGRAFTLVAVLALVGSAAVASASTRHHDDRRHGDRDRHLDDDDDLDRGRERAAVGQRIDPTYARECGSCHLAFPPRMLPADSWRTLMSGLGSHFGDDAELEPDVRAGIERWLVERAGRPPRGGDPAPLRITERPGFRSEHRKVASAAAANPAIASLANCAACHPGAERWDFEEDAVRVPPARR